MKSTDLISVFCRPVPFWSWNDKLEPDELRRQIGAMQDAGMGGFFMHARGGLETEYLSEDWFRAVEASVDEAKKRGMQAWCYDENGWPSGFAGGKLLEEVIRLMQLDGYEKFYLWAIDGNEIADGFYRKHGFLRTDDAVDYKSGGEPVRDVRYTRVLPSA